MMPRKVMMGTGSPLYFSLDIFTCKEMGGIGRKQPVVVVGTTRRRWGAPLGVSAAPSSAAR